MAKQKKNAIKIKLESGSSIAKTISEAPSDCPLVIELPKNEVFREKIHITHPDVTIFGNGSCIEWADCNSMFKERGTAKSATLTLGGQSFCARDLVVANTFDYPANVAKKEVFSGLQAVAVFVEPGAEETVFDSCIIKGHQDTLYVDGGHCLFLECTIEGCVDFIFGSAECDFHNCNIVSNGSGIVCAPSTKEETELGMCFIECNFTAGHEIEDNSVFLARPWHPGGNPGHWPFAFFSNCNLGHHINFLMWTSMTDSKGVVHTPEQSRFIMDEKSIENSLT